MTDSAQTPCVLIIGASGVGKSTLIQNSMARSWTGKWVVRVLKKYVTRPLRDQTEEIELSAIGNDEFEKGLREDVYLVHYQSYGEYYGIPRFAFENPPSSTLFLQAVPSKVALNLKSGLSNWDIKLCLLDADPEVIGERLMARGDEQTLKKFEARLKGADKNRRVIADVTIAANRNPSAVFSEFQAWAIRAFNLKA